MEQQPDITGKNTAKRSQKGHFAPGTTGNPKGRPKGTLSVTQAIKAKLTEVYKGDDLQKKKTYLQKIVEVIFDNAIVQKDQRALNQIWAYVDGYPKASVDLGADIDRSNMAELTAYFRKAAHPKI